VVEQRPMQEGRNMTMMMAPSKSVLAGRLDVGDLSNGEVHNGAHMGDVASTAIDHPLSGPQADGEGSENGGGEAAAAGQVGGEDEEPSQAGAPVEDAAPAAGESSPEQDGTASAGPAVP
jgi:translation initiation factor IF-3